MKSKIHNSVTIHLSLYFSKIVEITIPMYLHAHAHSLIFLHIYGKDPIYPIIMKYKKLLIIVTSTEGNQMEIGKA